LYDPARINDLFESVPGISAYRAENPENYGVLDTDGGEVVGVTEKPDDPDTNLVSAGACVLPSEAREWLDVEQSERGEYELTDVLDRVFAEYEVSSTELDRWMGVGRPWELLEANEWKLTELDSTVDGDVSERADLRGPVKIEEG